MSLPERIIIIFRGSKRKAAVELGKDKNPFNVRLYSAEHLRAVHGRAYLIALFVNANGPSFRFEQPPTILAVNASSKPPKLAPPNRARVPRTRHESSRYVVRSVRNLNERRKSTSFTPIRLYRGRVILSPRPFDTMLCAVLRNYGPRGINNDGARRVFDFSKSDDDEIAARARALRRSN